jgi:protein-S-isoprenylcysteine O-methyltransferase Ste14/rhodanese-related sulfurtransferase
VTGLSVLLGIGIDTGFSGSDFGSVYLILFIILVGLSGFVLSISLFGVISYFIFIPSIRRDGHIFNAAHSLQILHPLSTSVLLGLAALCIYTDSFVGWILWMLTATIYLFQTASIVRRIRRENTNESADGFQNNLWLLTLNLILGAEVITLAAGAKPLAPWKIQSLPADTWIVDVRTKPEFFWNRLKGAENYPWGSGLVEAAEIKSRDQPVLVTCLSGHRSPSVAVMLRRLGFKTVYNLNWGILYLILLERGKKVEGPFGLTRPHRDPNRRGEDLKAMSIAYVVLEAIILVLAPIESYYSLNSPSFLQQISGICIGSVGFLGAFISYRELGRNFRVFAAPRLSGTLITSGIYSHVRHPMYTSVIIMFMGYIIFFNSLLSAPLWLAFSALYIVKSIKEERIIIQRFPEYEEYRKKTWRFLPPII